MLQSVTVMSHSTVPRNNRIRLRPIDKSSNRFKLQMVDEVSAQANRLHFWQEFFCQLCATRRVLIGTLLTIKIKTPLSLHLAPKARRALSH